MSVINPDRSWNQTETNRGVTVTGAGSSGDEAVSVDRVSA